jgi:DNA-binding CsgD family transcriptional regulator
MRSDMSIRRTSNKTSARIVPGPQPAPDNAKKPVEAVLLLGREALARRAWQTAFRQLTAADRLQPLEANDLEQLGIAAHLSGREEECESVWTRAYHGFLAGGEIDRAARCAFSLGMMLFDRGQSAPGSGWIARARRLLDDHHRDSVERGYLMLPNAIASAMAGDAQAASLIFEQAAAIGDRFGDEDLRALARQGRGRALLRLGRIQEGVALLDEAMLAVMTNEVSPISAGIIYCSVIEACYEIFDLKRAQQWTSALGRWCDEQPELNSYRGACLVRRSEILQMHGIWTDALGEAMRACERLAERSRETGAGLAFYQLAEMHRLRGEFTKAEDAYRAASAHGKAPEPGYALLRLAQGHIELASATIRRARDEARDRKTKARVLVACVAILVAARDVAAARAAADEISAIAAELGAPLLAAYARQAAGAVFLAESNPQAALAPLRDAVSLWRELDFPYEAACTGVLIGLACRALDDRDAAALEFEAALRTFETLGARPDADRVKSLTRGEKEASGSLTARETQVLGLLATGRTNRAIAQQLRISEKTVARHLANIFMKIGVSTRSEATAYAFRHQLT